MKKFLLSSALMLLITGAFAQQSCPTNAKRNNGNSCTSGGTGGGIEVEFPNQPNVQLQIALITSGSGTATIIETTKQVSTRAGKWFIDWCFETDNIGPVVQGSVTYTFYLDLNNNGQQDLPGESSFICSQSTLPVTLTNFNAVGRSGKVALTWETATEVNNDGFAIERKVGNGVYEKIGFVDSKAPGGTGENFSYSFDDFNPQAKGVTYYRLAQADLDGKITYSEIRAVRLGNGAILISVYPNPSRGTTNVVLPDGVGTVDVSVDDFTGKSVQRLTGINSKNFQVNNLKPGIYMIRVNIRSTGETITERISVQ
ncbi:MAG: T9SS type A sorting domain-containing protein [Chitinophagaceae bacterium]|nr:T9SS type A sorting domain-containing protein [Chitinophagaceae bacterium]